MLKIRDHLDKIEEIENYRSRGYSSADIAIMLQLPLAIIIDEVMRFSDSSKMDIKQMNKEPMKLIEERINSLTEEELIFMYNDVVVRRLNQIECMKKFDIPYSFKPIVAKRLKDLNLDHKLNFLEKSKYFGHDQQSYVFIKIDKLENSLAEHYKAVYREKYGFSEELMNQMSNDLFNYTLSCEELAFKYNVNYMDVRSIIAVYYGLFSVKMISADKCFELIKEDYENRNDELLDVMNQLKMGEIFDIEAAIKLNCKIKLWRQVKDKLITYLNLDKREFELEKKAIHTQINLRHRFGESYHNVAQLDHVKEKMLNTIKEERVPMTRTLSILDKHPVFYEFSKYTEEEKEAELYDLIINRGYRAEDIVRISDIVDPHDITVFNQERKQITQLTTGDYALRVQAQIDKIKNASIQELEQLNERLNSVKIARTDDIFDYLYLPRRAFMSGVKITNDKYVSYDDDSKMILFPIELLDKSFSTYESSILKLLEELNVKYELHNRQILSGLEIDIYLPEHKIGIEVNPSFTHHSNKFVLNLFNESTGQSKDKHYHYNKYLIAKDAGITLIQLFEWDFCKSMLRPQSLKRLISIIKPDRILYARDCTVKEIEVATAKAFLSENHVNGYSNARYKYGLYYKEELVAVATFASVNYNNKQYDYELKRLAIKHGTRVIGSTSKLTKHFFRVNEGVNKIYSYSDNDWGSGSSYEKSNFTFISETGPSLRFVARKLIQDVDTYSWNIMTSVTSEKSVVGADRLSKGLSLDVNTYNLDQYIEEELTNRDGIHKGYDRIYTSGSKKWEISREDLNL